MLIRSFLLRKIELQLLKPIIQQNGLFYPNNDRFFFFNIQFYHCAENKYCFTSSQEKKIKKK